MDAAVGKADASLRITRKFAYFRQGFVDDLVKLQGDDRSRSEAKRSFVRKERQPMDGLAGQLAREGSMHGLGKYK